MALELTKFCLVRIKTRFRLRLPRTNRKSEVTHELLCAVLQAFVGERGVDAGATLKLRMVRFVNPGGKDYGGDCCDRHPFWCTGSCDHYFRFALDTGYRYKVYTVRQKTAPFYIVKSFVLQ